MALSPQEKWGKNNIRTGDMEIHPGQKISRTTNRNFCGPASSRHRLHHPWDWSMHAGQKDVESHHWSLSEDARVSEWVSHRKISIFRTLSPNDPLLWCDSSPTGLEKMYFSREDSYNSHYFLCISLLKNTKFPTKWSHFPGRSFLISTFFPTMITKPLVSKMPEAHLHNSQISATLPRAYSVWPFVNQYKLHKATVSLGTKVPQYSYILDKNYMHTPIPQGRILQYTSNCAFKYYWFTTGKNEKVHSLHVPAITFLE